MPKNIISNIVSTDMFFLHQFHQKENKNNIMSLKKVSSHFKPKNGKQNGRDMAENGPECLKPSHFDMPEVEKFFGMLSGREVKNGKNGKKAKND